MIIEFDDYKQKLLALEPTLAELRRGLNMDGALAQLEELEDETAAEGFWNDLERSQVVLRDTKRLKEKIGAYRNLHSSWEDLTVLRQLGQEEQDPTLLAELVQGYGKLVAALEQARLSTLLGGEYDASSAILSFHAGAGGTEAQDWTQMLVRMYTRWAERHGFSCRMLDFLDGDEAGLKSAVLLIEGVNVYGFLKGEHGVHRLVRISPFDSSGRRHTSFAALEVMPEITDDAVIEIRDEDLQVDTYRSGGKGGQHVNKTESAIRITHVPSGVVVACQNERSQHQNREVAMRMLRSKLAEIKEREHLSKVEDIKGEQKAIEWGSQIRSYTFMPYTLAKDHRTGFESGNIGATMDGDLDGFISAYLTAAATGVWAAK